MSNALDLEGFKKRLKRSAIDAWMKTEADSGPWERNGDRYESEIRLGYPMRVTGPDENGVGGGQWSYAKSFLWMEIESGSEESTDYFTSWFDSIRSTIDAIIEPWYDIPRDDALSEQLKAITRAARNYPGSDLSEHGVATGGNVELDVSLKAIEANAEAMSGATMESYRNTFVRRLKNTIDNLSIVHKVQHNAVAAQQDLWTTSRTKLSHILDSAENGMIAIAAGGSLAPENNLGSIEFAVALLTLVPGPVGVVAGVASATSDLLSKQDVVESQFWSPETATTCTAALMQLNEALNGLDGEILAREQEIKRIIDTNIEAIWNAKANYDLKPSAITNQHPDDVTGERPEDNGDIRFKAAELKTLFNNHMPNTAGALNAMAATHSTFLIGTSMRRDLIGLTPNGAGPRIDEFAEIYRDLLLDLAAEVLEGCVSLERVYHSIAQLEQDTVTTINHLQAELDQHSVNDPLDRTQQRDTAPERDAESMERGRKNTYQGELSERIESLMNGDDQ